MIFQDYFFQSFDTCIRACVHIRTIYINKVLISQSET